MHSLAFEAPSKPPAAVEVRVPGDKSISHRALLCAAVAGGTSTIAGLNQGADVASTRSVLEAVGVAIRRRDDGSIEVRGTETFTEPSSVLDCGNSGSTMRMLAGLLAGKVEAAFDGDESLRRRPMERVAAPLRAMGATVTTRDGKPPLGLHGRRTLEGKRFELEVASAQVKTALLFAGLCASGDTTVVEPAQTRDHTERMLSAMGAAIERRGLQTTIRRSRLRAFDRFDVPGDFSSAFFFVVAAAATPGARVRIKDVGVNPTRTAALDVVRAMGADVRLTGLRETGGEPVADIEIEGGRPLNGIAISPLLVPNLIDEVPALCALATCAHGTTLIRGASELRAKESDRIATTAALCRAFGAEVEEHDDGLAVRGPRRAISAPRVNTAGDHRIGMSAAVLALLARAPVTIEDGACIETSFPGFDAVWRAAFFGI